MKINILIFILAGFFCNFVQTKSLSDEDFDKQIQCSKVVKEFIANQNFGDDTPNYTNHFNSKLNKCFVDIDSSNIQMNSIAHSIVDAVENKDYGQCLEVNYKTTAPCWVMNQDQNKVGYGDYYSWETAVKHFMSD